MHVHHRTAGTAAKETIDIRRRRTQWDSLDIPGALTGVIVKNRRYLIALAAVAMQMALGTV